MKRFSIVTLFPDFIDAFGRTGVVRRCLERGLIAIDAVNPRDFAADRRGTVDDASYGGGPGMILMAEPVRKAVAAAKTGRPPGAHVIYLTPQGRRFDHRGARELGALDHLILIAGRYEGVDERVVERDVDSEWSVGDFVLSGGEIPAMAMVDAIVRLLPGALGDERSAREDSFCEDLLDHPHYTRPEHIDGESVPAVLLSGDHAAIERWRRMQRLGRTFLKRPDLLESAALSASDRALLAEFLENRGDEGD